MTFPAPDFVTSPWLDRVIEQTAERHRPHRRTVLTLALSAAPLSLVGLGCEAGPVSPAVQPQPQRSIEKLVAVPTMDGRGARVRRVFPSQLLSYQDPFVLLDDFSVAEPAGFPEHPHRGFEAFTYMIDGGFHHKDTMGNDSVCSTGGTQRFTSGKGARHSEMPVGSAQNRGLQLWINLPRSLKKMEPEYEAVQGGDIPENGKNGVVTRTIVGKESPVKLRTAVRYLHLKMDKGARFEDEIPADNVALIYVAEGRVKLGDLELSNGEGAKPGDGELGMLALADAHAFVLLGKRHHEPIIHRGPFVD
ncbi:MAG: pirin family protein [Polyangiaceae bacterium]|nr:pirin family protein [Polyangiaceae bacterium]